MTRPTLLIVDDEKNTRDGLARALRRHYEVLLAENGEQALNRLSEQSVDVVLSDIRMPGMDGLTVMQRMLARTPQPVCILMTAYGSIDTAVEAMKKGAYDFLTKPVNLDRLELLLQRALRTRDIEQENRNLHEQLNHKFGLESIVGQSAAMQSVFDTTRQVAPSRATVLIEGESGTGKELVAQAIHRLSPRSKAAFVPIHCAALSHNLLESELFGHEKGAFTGASETRRGRFELADGGSLFLDEIGEIDASVQVKILRVLEERRFERVGGQQTIDTDVRLIAATNRNLKAMVDAGDFREDLYYRLNVVSIRMPALRERRSDVPMLLNHFLEIYRKENARDIEGITPDAIEALCAYDWPGNVRELRNAVERMVVLSRGPKITLRDVPAAIRDQVPGSGMPARAGGDYSLEEAERSLMLKALEAHQGNRTRAAEQLGISRRTLHRKIKELGVEPRRKSKPLPPH